MAEENTVETAQGATDHTSVPTPADIAPDKTQENKDVTENEERTFTQAELDRIIAGRLSKYADYEEMKTRLEQIEEQSLSEKEREVKRAREEALAEATAAANQRIVKAEARALAAEDFENPTVAVRLADLSEVTVNEDGEVDVAALKAALKVVANEAPSLLKTRKGSLGAQGHSSGAMPTQETEEERARRILGL